MLGLRSLRSLVLAASWLSYSVSTSVAQQLDLPAPPKASLLDFRLELGTPVTPPPGDRLVASVLLYPGVQTLDLTLEAEFVQQKNLSQPSATAATARPVLSKGPAGRESDGHFRLHQTVTGTRDGKAAKVIFVVPYEQINLEKNRFLIRYNLIGKVGKEPAFESSTGLIAYPSQLAFPPEIPNPPPAMTVTVTQTPITTMRANPPSSHIPAGPYPSLQSPPVPSKTMPAPAKVAPAPQAPSFSPTFDSYAPIRKRPVLFATNRNLVNQTGTPSQRFGNMLAPLSYGTCLVDIPAKTHIQGKLELPGWFTGSSPEKFFLIDSTTLLADRSIFQSLVRGAETRGDVLIYVHGFNTPFDDAVLRLGQVVQDIRFPGVPVLFSWPSRGEFFAYDTDEATAMASVDALADTLLALIAAQQSRPETRRGKVNVLAHSLGNRLTLRALAKLDTDPRIPPGAKPFGQIILAAPDVSVAEFTTLVPTLNSRAERVSLYFCRDDEALRASEVRHPEEPRAGRTVVPIPGLDNIDSDKANTSFLGHAYWAEAKQLLNDFHLLINLNWTPEQRAVINLDPVTLPQPPFYRYWEFR